MSDATDTPNDTDELAAAEAEVEQARAEVGRVEDALLDGQPGIKTTDLVSAEIVVREKVSLLDRIRRVQAGRAERAVEKARVARVSELVATVTGFGGSTESRVPTALDAVSAAVADAVTILASHNDDLRSLVLEFRAVKPVESRRVTVAPSGFRLDIHALGDDSETVEITQYDVQELLAAAVAVGVTRATGATDHLAQTAAGTESADAHASGVTVDGVHWYSPAVARTRRRARLIATATTKGARS